MKNLSFLFLLLLSLNSIANISSVKILNDGWFYLLKDTSFINIHIMIEGQHVNTIQVLIPDEHIFMNRESDKIEISGKNFFDFKIPFNSSSFFAIRFNNELLLPLAAKAGDSIAIKAERTQKGTYAEYKLNFTASNSEANTIYFNRFYPAGKNLGFFDDLPKLSLTYTDYYVSSKNYIDSITYVWDSLYIHKKITEDIYKLYVAETKGTLYDVSIRRLSKVSPKDSGWSSYTKWLQIKHVMYFNGDASNPLHLKTYTGKQLYNNYLNNILREDDNINDSLLKKSSMGYFYYYDTSYREKAWGSKLLYLNFFGGLKGDVDKIDLAAFKLYYPNSSYLSQIKNSQDSIINERKALHLPINIIMDEFGSLEDIMNSINGRYLFIDVWATWCLPCTQEFKNYTRLSEFLMKNDIKGIFLSIDRKKDSDKWVNYIKSEHLGGEHFLINENIQNELLKVISEGKSDNTFSIPRYLMYDKLAKKYYIDLPRPSSGIVLESIISDILNRK